MVEVVVDVRTQVRVDQVAQVLTVVQGVMVVVMVVLPVMGLFQVVVAAAQKTRTVVPVVMVRFV